MKSSSVRSLSANCSMSKLTKTPFRFAAARIGARFSRSPRIDPSVSIGSTRAESELILIETFVRGIGPRWSVSRRGFASQVATVAGRLSMRSRYLRRYASASSSLTHASPRRSTEKHRPLSQMRRSPGSELAASVPQMNFDAIDVICVDIVFVTTPFMRAPALSAVATNGGGVTPGCAR